MNGSTSYCGDGILDKVNGEVCDPGSTIGCSNTCHEEDNSICDDSGKCIVIPTANETVCELQGNSSFPVGSTISIVILGAYPSRKSYLAIVNKGLSCNNYKSSWNVNQTVSVQEIVMNEAGLYEICYSINSKTTWYKQSLIQIEIQLPKATTTTLLTSSSSFTSTSIVPTSSVSLLTTATSAIVTSTTLPSSIPTQTVTYTPTPTGSHRTGSMKSGEIAGI